MKPKIAVSSCLLGEKVRYDGGDKELHLLTKELSHFFDIRSICPEMLMGLGVPRPAIYAQKSAADSIKLKRRVDNEDLTELAHQTFNESISTQIDDINGFIFKSRSPSCAIQKLAFNPGDEPVQGVFAHAIITQRPDLIVVDQTNLVSALQVLSFVLKVYLKSKVIPAELASLFEFKRIEDESEFYRDLNQISDLELLNRDEFKEFYLLANRLSS